MGVTVEIVFAFSSRTKYPDLPLGARSNVVTAFPVTAMR